MPFTKVHIGLVHQFTFFSNVFLQICQRECIYPKLILLAISYAGEEESQIRNFVVILPRLALVEHIQDTMPASVPKDITAKDSLAIVPVRYLIFSAHLKAKFLMYHAHSKKFFLARVDFFRVMCLLCGCSMSLGNVQANTWARRQKVLHSVSQSWSNESLGKLGIISVPMQRRIHLTLRKVSN